MIVVVDVIVVAIVLVHVLLAVVAISRTAQLKLVAGVIPNVEVGQ